MFPDGVAGAKGAVANPAVQTDGAKGGGFEKHQDGTGAGHGPQRLLDGEATYRLAPTKATDRDGNH